MSDERIESQEERLIVLRDKAAREGFVVGDDVLEYIAGKYALANTLKGALINVQALASRKGVPVTLSVARLALDGIREPDVAASPAEPVEGDAWDEEVVEPADEWALTVEEIEATEPEPDTWDEPVTPVAEEHGPDPAVTGTLFVPPPPATPAAPVPAYVPAPTETRVEAEPAVVWFAPMRSVKKESLVKRVGNLLKVAGIKHAIDDGDLVAVKLHFGEEGNTGFVQPVFLREVVRQVRKRGGKPFLTDCNTLYRGKRGNAVDHLNCAVHNGFAHATLNAPIIIADGLNGRDGVDVPIEGFKHFDSVRIGAAAVHADAMVVVTHVKGHEATGFGGAIKNVGMGLGTRAAKQRMHSDLKPQVNAEKCTACKRCVKSCPVHAIEIRDKVAVIDYEKCYGCGECVAACPYGAIGIQWKTEPEAIQEKMVEHCAGALAEKDGKVIYLSFVTNVSPDCDCWSFSDASIVADIGVLASTDLVAIDQAAYDLVTAAPGLPGSRGEDYAAGVDKFREVTGIDGTVVLSYAEEHGLGTRTYELKTLE
jgi:hypothetical protein